MPRSDDQWDSWQSDEIEPPRHRTPVRHNLNPNGTLASEFIARGMSRHGETCTCVYCAETPGEAAVPTWLQRLREGGAL